MVALLLLLSCSDGPPWYLGDWQASDSSSRLRIDVAEWQFEQAAPFPCSVQEQSEQRAVLELHRGQEERWTLERDEQALVVDRGDRRFRFERAPTSPR